MQSVQIKSFKILMVLIMTAGCSAPDTSSTPTSDPKSTTGFLVPGKGVRVLLEATIDPTISGTSINSTALSAQDDGTVSWTYGTGACCGGSPTLYRRKFDGQTGKALTPDGDLKKITRTDMVAGFDQYGGSIRYVQGTGKLYQSTRNNVTGDVPDYTNSDNNTFTGPPLVYPDGDVVISSNPTPIGITPYNYSSQLWVRRKHGANNQFFQTINQTGNDPDAFWHGGVCYPSDANGAITCLTSTASQALVIDVQGSGSVTPKIVGSAPFAGARIQNAINISVQFRVKTRADHSKTTIFMLEAGDNALGDKPGTNRYSTFIVDNLTHAVTVVVASQILTDVYDRYNGLDFDFEGNIYFFKWSAAEQSDKASVVKQTAAGPSVFKSDFLVASTTPHALVVSATGSVYAVLGGKGHFAVCGLN